MTHDWKTMIEVPGFGQPVLETCQRCGLFRLRTPTGECFYMVRWGTPGGPFTECTGKAAEVIARKPAKHSADHIVDSADDGSVWCASCNAWIAIPPSHPFICMGCGGAFSSADELQDHCETCTQ